MNDDHPNGRLNRLLIPVEGIETAVQRSDIKRMLEQEGIWIGGDSNHPDVTVPLASMGGKVYAMKRDHELAPERFLPTLTLAGPFRAQHPPPEAWIPAATALPPPLTLVLIWFASGDQRVGQWVAEENRWAPPKADKGFRRPPTHWQQLPPGP